MQFCAGTSMKLPANLLLKSVVIAVCHRIYCLSFVIPRASSEFSKSGSPNWKLTYKNSSRIIYPLRNSYDSVIIKSVQEDDLPSNVDWKLHEQAKRFGQSFRERLRVSRILRTLQNFASRQHYSGSNEKQPVMLSRSEEKRHDLVSGSHNKSRRTRHKTKSTDYYKRKPFSQQVVGRFADSDATEEHNPEEAGGHFEGDIVLWENQAEAIAESVLHDGKRRKKRKFIAPLARRWNPDKIIEFSFDGSHSKREKKIIELAMEHWQNITCLNFEKKTDKPKGNRIVFTDVDGCASNVGRHPLGEPQFVSIAPECLRLGVIAHEVAHALGFWHEQSRPDRDLFVDVVWNNIDRGSKGQFLKEQPDDVDSAAVPYDYGSIMHYRSKAFSRYDDLFTIHTNVRDFQRTIGQRDQLSFNDIRLMNKIYCSHKCPVKLPCQRGGYTDPRRCDRCRCPDGFTGKLCEEVMTGYGTSCGGEIQLGDSWVTVNSPNYPQEFKEGQECSWLFRAPPGQHVDFQFVDTFDMYCKAKHSLCMDYVEIRNTTDFANTGMRYCCYGTPRGSVYSATEDMLVLFRSFYRSGKGFKGRARSGNRPQNVVSIVTQALWEKITRRTFLVEASGSWSDWGPWSICTGSCGGCGTQTRKRSCSFGICSGNGSEVRSCNENPCDLCPETRYVSAPCGGFLGLLRGIRCKVERTVYAPCRDKCCNGLQVKDGVCKP